MVIKKTSIIFFFILIICSIASCDIQKQASKTKTDTDFKEQIETTEKRDGGIATYIPPANIIYRDTTIYVQGTNGTQLKVIYDKQGIIQQADCNAALIDVITKYNSQLLQTTKEKEKTKIEEFNSTWILYLIGGVVVVFIVAMLLMYRTMNKHASNVTNMFNELRNK